MICLHIQLGSIADRTIAEVDASGDDVISFEEFMKVCLSIKKYRINNETSVNIFQLGSIADRTIAEADKTGDNVISFDEFNKVWKSGRYIQCPKSEISLNLIVTIFMKLGVIC